MTFNMHTFPWVYSEPLIQLFTALSGNPTQSTLTLRFVGGCVRDFLLDNPWKDIDLATILSPEEVIIKLQDAYIPFITPGILHGTITALLDQKPFEITTLRKDIAPDGRHSSVEFINSWEEDALRRDFTINALFMDWTGHVYDFIGGIPDLRAGRIKFVGDPSLRIREDFLRILRLFRMYAFYGKLPIDPHTLNIVKTYAHKLITLSRERIHSEFFKILDAPHLEKSLSLMEELGVLTQTFVYFKIPSYFKNLLEEDALLKCASLLLQTNKCLRASDLKPILLSTRDIKRVLDILNYKPFLLDEIPLNFSPPFLFKTKFPLYRDLIILKSAILKTPPSETQSLITKAQDVFPHLIFPLTGQDLLNLGVKEGPLLGRILMTIEEKWLESNCQLSKEECLNLAKKQIVEN